MLTSRDSTHGKNIWLPNDLSMGDIPTGSQPLGSISSTSSDPKNNERQFPDQTPNDNFDARNSSHESAQFRTTQSGYQNMQPYSPQTKSPSRQDAFSMSTMGHGLPDLSYQAYRSPTQPFAGQSTPLQYQMQHQQFGGLANMNQQVPYNMQYHPQYQGMYAPGPTQVVSSISPGVGMGSQYYQGQTFVGHPQQPTAPYLMQPSQYRGQNQVFPGGAPLPSTKGAFAGDNRYAVGPQGSDYLGGTQPNISARSGSIASNASQSSVVRGPPRKPRQSGHAIWIGNLPPHTDLMSLVLHVCKETEGLESLFLISKSNCAFANFKDETACAAAQLKIHDSRFQSVRLVSRLRRGSNTPPARAGPASSGSQLDPPSVPVVASTPSVDGDLENPIADSDVSPARQPGGAETPRDKFFIVKSLTVEDLELSVRNGIWATQSHNEDTLNQAYQSAENVYLLFSANKSGEYFGYAKMASPINDDPAAAIEFAPKAHAVEDPELPKAIPTPATEFTPNGRIIDDSARGTIFWEAERDEMVDGEVDGVDETQSDDETGSSKKAWGKPFKIEWISTTRLPFYRTRGLRNPWNSNREVKIARDGTELETNVGQRLISLFHRVHSPVASLQPAAPLMGVYPPMRNFP